MYIKFENREQGKKFTFFERECEINGEKVKHTDKCVFGTLSESIKTGENNGKAIWTHDYWNVTFCGKAYEKALNLQNNTKIITVEFNIRNPYHKPSKKSYPQITVTDFDVSGGDNFMNVPDSIDEEIPFK